ncbi:AzlC family ABC transporter permease [Peptostreptococcaceae bacterium AGR-M142]
MIAYNELKYDVKEGFYDALPMMIGFIPIAMTFGVLAKNDGIDMFTTVLFSSLVFAGASQFIALNLLLVGCSAGEIIITTLLVNFRHFLMSASLSNRLDKSLKKISPIIAFGVTDESFSIMSFKEGELSKEYIITLEYLAYFAWVAGTFLGFLLGGILPVSLTNAMGISLYAMFIAILVPEVKKSNVPLVLALLSGLSNFLLKSIVGLQSGWSIVLSIILVSMLGVYLFERNEQYE